MSTNSSSFEQVYQANALRYRQLKEEVEFILRDIARRANVKIHSVSGRVKDLEGAIEKIQRKEYENPVEELEDVVGCRIVCLFISDIEKIERAIMKEFKVRKSEDKVEGGDDVATFGYMSKHYICQLSPAHSGPRYDGLKDLIFEVQCRTLLMDAWANVSHYLAYKGSASIPPHLRRDFFALSGLFYVADKHFELFLNEAINSERKAVSKATAGKLADDRINLETVLALFVELYPDRTRATRRTVSQFVEEVTSAGYETLAELREDLKRASEASIKYEKDWPPGVRDKSGNPRRFLDVGIARQALGILERSGGSNHNEPRWKNYRKYLS